MRSPERHTAPSSRGGRPTGTNRRARRIMSDFNFLSELGFLLATFAAGGLRVLAGLAFTVPLADLLLDFLGRLVDRSVEVAVAIFRVEVWATHAQANGTVELALG